jgi:hypothetical protein
MNKKVESAYDWSIIPKDIPKKNLLLIKAKTIHPTIHPDDMEYPIRIFDPEELYEAARSLSHRVIGLNHWRNPDGSPILLEFSPQEAEQFGTKYAFTVDSNWNKDTQAIEALACLPEKYMNIVKQYLAEGRKDLFSVEYAWREEVPTEKGTLFKGFTFDKIDMLYGVPAGDKNVDIKLVESEHRGKLYESEVILPPPEKGMKDELIQDSIDTSPEEPFVKEACSEGMEISKRLGEPLHKDYQKIKSKMVAQYGKDKGEQVYYAWLNKHNYDDTKAFPNKEANIPHQDTEQIARLSGGQMGIASLTVPLPEKCECAACLKLHAINMALHPEAYAQEKAKSKPSQIELFGPSGVPSGMQEPQLTIQSLQPEDDEEEECSECKESKSQIPEKPVSPMASDPTPMSALTQPQDNTQPQGASGVSVSGMLQFTVPPKQEGKDLEQSTPLKSGDLTYTGVDKSKQRVESECMDFNKKLIELENRMKIIEDMMKCPK